MLIVSKKKKSTNWNNRSFFGLQLKEDFICHVISVSNLTFGFVLYLKKNNFDGKISIPNIICVMNNSKTNKHINTKIAPECDLGTEYVRTIQFPQV